MNNTAATYKTKTLVENHPVKVSLTTVNTPVSLLLSDVYKIKGIINLNASSSYKNTWGSGTTYNINEVVLYDNELYQSLRNSNLNNTPSTLNSSYWKLSAVSNILSNYSIDLGQKTTYYDHATITPKITSALGHYIVLVDYFTHSSPGDFFNLDSYPVDYKNIPNFTDNFGVKYELRDYLDFRPRRTDGATSIVFDSHKIPRPLSDCVANYTYYLSRVDKLVLTENKQFKVIKGIPNYGNPLVPALPQRSMEIATIFYNAYGFSRKDINIVYAEHKRYTMEDIGRLDKRIDRIEEYTTLSLAESDALNSQKDDAILASRLKTGILVDSFSSDILNFNSSPENKCTIYTGNKYCTSRNYLSANYVFKIKSTEGYMKDNIIYGPIESIETIYDNVQVTGDMNLNPFDKNSFNGHLKLNPSTDNWNEVVSASIKPITVVLDPKIATNDVTSTKKAITSIKIGSEKTSVTGLESKVGGSTSAETIFKKVLAITSAQEQNVSYSSSQVINVESEVKNPDNDYIREKDINLNASGLAPLTKMYVFIDNTFNATGYCRPISNPTRTITNIQLTSGGSGYTTAPTVSISGSNTSIATATATISDGKVTDVAITNYGEGYVPVGASKATISFSGGGGSGATASVSFTPVQGMDLYTDITGKFKCILKFPRNKNKKFKTGNHSITVCNHPILPKYALSSATATYKGISTQVDQYNVTVKETQPPSLAPSKDVVISAPTTKPSTQDTAVKTVVYEANTSYPQWLNGSATSVNLITGNEKNLTNSGGSLVNVFKTTKVKLIGIPENETIDDYYITSYSTIGVNETYFDIQELEIDSLYYNTYLSEKVIIEKVDDKWDCKLKTEYTSISKNNAWRKIAQSINGKNITSYISKSYTELIDGLIFSSGKYNSDWYIPDNPAAVISSGDPTSSNWTYFGSNSVIVENDIEIHNNDYYFKNDDVDEYLNEERMEYYSYDTKQGLINAAKVMSHGYVQGIQFIDQWNAWIDATKTDNYVVGVISTGQLQFAGPGKYKYLVKIRKKTLDTNGAVVSIDSEDVDLTSSSVSPDAIKAADEFLRKTYVNYL